jgi:hypothetical protein
MTLPAHKEKQVYTTHNHTQLVYGRRYVAVTGHTRKGSLCPGIPASDIHYLLIQVLIQVAGEVLL